MTFNSSFYLELSLLCNFTLILYISLDSAEATLSVALITNKSEVNGRSIGYTEHSETTQCLPSLPLSRTLLQHTQHSLPRPQLQPSTLRLLIQLPLIIVARNPLLHF